MHYLLKPFTFAGFRDKLECYADDRSSLVGETAGQSDIDSALSALRGGGSALPKGLTTETLALVVAALKAAGEHVRLAVALMAGTAHGSR